MEPVLDLQAYFGRVGYRGPVEPTLAVLREIARCHTASIPFENLDVLLGRAISLDPAVIERKLVADHRGGYCFEQNNLLMRVLRAIGFEVIPLSARVRIKAPRDYVPPRTHLFLQVNLDGVPWLMDAGIGALSATAPLRLDTHAEQPTLHEPRRIVKEDGLYYHQVKFGDQWNDIFDFTFETMPPIDCELANWWTSTSPHSKFRNNLMIGMAGPDRQRYTVLNSEYTHRQGAQVLERRQMQIAAELLEVLATRFGLHFPAGTRFIVPNATWPTV